MVFWKVNVVVIEAQTSGHLPIYDKHFVVAVGVHAGIVSYFHSPADFRIDHLVNSSPLEVFDHLDDLAAPGEIGKDGIVAQQDANGHAARVILWISFHLLVEFAYRLNQNSAWTRFGGCLYVLHDIKQHFIFGILNQCGHLVKATIGCDLLVAVFGSWIGHVDNAVKLVAAVWNH